MDVTLDSSETALVAGWEWAKTQALNYVRHGDPVGDWIEASLPGRNGFCMRDVAHQSAGAQVLGLRSEVKNMLRRFAENISDVRDWCSFWEISGDNQPIPVDYTDDGDFWYNLPANFDVLDCCWRQYQWTADSDYIVDPVFLNFYDRTVQDYVQRWDSNHDGLLEHQLQFGRRGIGSYEETVDGIRTASDLVAAQSAAYDAYSHIVRLRAEFEKADLYAKKAANLRERYEKDWWHSEASRFYSVLRHDSHFSKFANTNIDNLALYFGLVRDTKKVQSVIDHVMREFSTMNIEAQSYVPEVAYHYGRSSEAFNALCHLINPTLARREYPEISYSVIGCFIIGLMGVSANASHKKITTMGRLSNETAWISVEYLPILENQIAIRHQGNSETTLCNQQGQAIVWEARFATDTDCLLVDGSAKLTSREVSSSGDTESWTEINIPAGEKHTVRLP